MWFFQKVGLRFLHIAAENLLVICSAGLADIGPGVCQNLFKYVGLKIQPKRFLIFSRIFSKNIPTKCVNFPLAMYTEYSSEFFLKVSQKSLYF